MSADKTYIGIIVRENRNAQVRVNMNGMTCVRALRVWKKVGHHSTAPIATDFVANQCECHATMLTNEIDLCCTHTYSLHTYYVYL